MSSTVQHAVKDGCLITLTEVQRGEASLTCYTCGDRIAVKDGKGRFVDGKVRHNRAKGKHFSHTSNSRCHGEGAAHYGLKVALCASINEALVMRQDQRNMHGYIQYLCPDAEYGPHDAFKHAPGKDAVSRPFPSMEHGYHHFDLLANLARAEREVSLDGGRTRADVAGLDPVGRVLWVIEIKRTGLRRAAIEHAEREGVPLFVVDISDLPKPTEDEPFAEITSWPFYLMGDNLSRGFLPSVSASYSTECERRAFGMGPGDHYWKKEYAYVHCGPGDCQGGGCPNREQVLLHQCGGGEDAMMCSDTRYMFERGITPVQMYTDPAHLGGVVKRVCSRSSLPGVGKWPGMTPLSWRNGSPLRATA